MKKLILALLMVGIITSYGQQNSVFMSNSGTSQFAWFSYSDFRAAVTDAHYLNSGSSLSWANITGVPSNVTNAVSNSTTITINGVANDLSTNRTWSNVGIELPSQTGNSGRYLTTNGSAVSWASLTFPGASSVEATAAGTAYNLTSTYAKVALGTTSPTVTLPAAGTYAIFTNTKVDYTGLTTLSTGNINLKLRRTNNTPADILGSFSFPLGVVTLLSSTAADVDVRQFLYTTATSGDVVELWGQVTNTISLGNVQINANGATLTALRLY